MRLQTRNSTACTSVVCVGGSSGQHQSVEGIRHISMCSSNWHYFPGLPFKLIQRTILAIASLVPSPSPYAVHVYVR